MSKKSNLATANQPNPDAIKNHDHIHASNCGHKSFVHGDHIDYFHDGHYHYTKDGQTFLCPGPDAKVLKFDPSAKKK